ncbi:hypothetical protein C7N83_07495 [Neisseria iguanae]|uniref:Uncharacterized protein n=1 Tax=Neisseria iguanae TaxID=90242 RepID=A0A2P7TZZ4_9NEIS|nr:hypothetical protein C7N83_07495 [Neisseria iguanae]
MLVGNQRGRFDTLRPAGKTGRLGKVGYLARMSDAANGFYAGKRPHDDMRSTLHSDQNLNMKSKGRLKAQFFQTA